MAPGGSAGGFHGGTGLMQGIVYAAPNAGKRLSGAKVSVGGHTLYTDGNGYFHVKLPAGTYTVTASDGGYQTGRVRRQLAAGGNTWGSVGLKRAAQLTHGFLTGVVYRSPSASNRIAGARVTLSGGKTTTTDASGHFRFEVHPGTYTVTASRSGYVSGSATRQVRANQTVWAGVGLHKESAAGRATVKGVVYAYPNASRRIAGARVTLANGATVTTGSDGYFEFHVAPGNWQVTAKASGYKTGYRRRPVAAGGVVWSSVGLTRAQAGQTGTLIGVIYEKGNLGHRLAGARVTLSSGQSAVADDHGVYKITGVPAGAVTVSAAAGGYQPGSVKRTVGAGRTVWGSVALTQGTTGGAHGIVDAVLVSPAKDATTGANPTFTWKAVTSAQMNGKHFSYYIEIYQHNDVGFQDFTVAAGASGEISQNFKVDLAAGIWEWRVEAVPDGVNPEVGGQMTPFTVQ